MDYLCYVEHQAEPLQFFLWYCDYIQRWSQLLPRQKASSPRWEPDKAAEPASRFITYSHKRARSDKMSKIISIMERQSEVGITEHLHDGNTRRSNSLSLVFNFSRPLTETYSITSQVDSPKHDWQPCTSTIFAGI